MNLSYYCNVQWIAWDGQQLYRPRMKRSRITIVDNRISPIVRTEVAKILKNHPVFTVTPRTGDDEDVNAAQVGEQILRYSWPHLSMSEHLEEALLWSRICGAGFVKTFWDPAQGDGVDVCVGPDGQVLCDPSGRPMRAGDYPPQALMQMGVQTKTINQGDIRLEVRSPFQMYLDPLASRFPDVEWMIEESVKSVEHVKQRYGVELPADTNANPGMLESRMGAAIGGTGSYKGVKLREYWCRPGTQHPHGCRVVWSKDQILKVDQHPFDALPYIMLKGIPVPGRMWPGSVVEQLRGPQDELNKVKSQIAENRNRVGNPTVLASKQAVQDADKFTDALTIPGGAYFYDDTGTQNAVPAYLAAPTLPPYVLEEIQRIEESLQEISGQHEVTSASVPPGVTAASAINLLQEADDTRLGPAIRDYEEQLGELGRKILSLVAEYYTDTRTVRIAGENDAWEIFDFRGSMLRDNTHVEVQAGSAFPQSKAAKQAFMQDVGNMMIQSGQPLQGRQMARFMRIFGIGGMDSFLAEYTVDETQINRENSQLARGMPLGVNEFDNDQAHIDGHEDFQKSNRYTRLPHQAQQAFEQHVQAHRDRIAAQQQAQMQLEMQQQGIDPQQQAAQQQMEMQGKQQDQDLQAQQAAQQQDAAQAQAMQQLGQGAAQQDQQAAQAVQQQQQAEDAHQQKLRHADEQHQQKLRQAAAQAARQSQPTPGGPNGR